MRKVKVALRHVVIGAALSGLIVGCGSDPEPPSNPGQSPRSEQPRRLEKVVFEDGWQSVFVMNPDGTDVVRIGAGNHPSFARDGSKIVVGGAAISTMDPDGGNVRRLTDGGYHPKFSPDGARIAFARGGAIYAINADGGDLKQLTALPDPTAPPGPGQASSQNPAFSPDGSKILFTRSGAIWVMAADGTHARQVLADPFWNSDPVFTPDATKIVFTSNRGGKNRSEIYVMHANGADVRPLTDDATVHPSFSPDGSKIVYTRNPAPEPGAQIWVMNSDGSNARQLTDPKQTAQHPSWGAGH
ncbi:hypothetical protein [Nocardia sp. NPDC052316]|uniref:hypothetical protein n=1 Tax=Nocardia sp. NPDC052316 TaxID=3364329 RepID=UPI0037C60E8A